jgi:hypothetical protein
VIRSGLYRDEGGESRGDGEKGEWLKENEGMCEGTRKN